MENHGIEGSWRGGDLDGIIQALLSGSPDTDDVLKHMRANERDAYGAIDGMATALKLEAPARDASKRQQRRFRLQLAYFLTVVKQDGNLDSCYDYPDQDIRRTIYADEGIQDLIEEMSLSLKDTFHYEVFDHRLNIERLCAIENGVLTQYLEQAEKKARRAQKRTGAGARRPQQRPGDAATPEEPPTRPAADLYLPDDSVAADPPAPAPGTLAQAAPSEPPPESGQYRTKIDIYNSYLEEITHRIADLKQKENLPESHSDAMVTLAIAAYDGETFEEVRGFVKLDGRRAIDGNEARLLLTRIGFKGYDTLAGYAREYQERKLRGSGAGPGAQPPQS